MSKNQVLLGLFLFIWGAVSLVFHKRWARQLMRHQFKYLGKKYSETPFRVTYIVSGVIFMAVGVMVALGILRLK